MPLVGRRIGIVECFIENSTPKEPKTMTDNDDTDAQRPSISLPVHVLVASTLPWLRHMPLEGPQVQSCCVAFAVLNGLMRRHDAVWVQQQRRQATDAAQQDTDLREDDRLQCCVPAVALGVLAIVSGRPPTWELALHCTESLLHSKEATELLKLHAEGHPTDGQAHHGTAFPVDARWSMTKLPSRHLSNIREGADGSVLITAEGSTFGVAGAVTVPQGYLLTPAVSGTLVRDMWRYAAPKANPSNGYFSAVLDALEVPNSAGRRLVVSSGQSIDVRLCDLVRCDAVVDQGASASPCASEEPRRSLRLRDRSQRTRFCIIDNGADDTAPHIGPAFELCTVDYYISKLNFLDMDTGQPTRAPIDVPECVYACFHKPSRTIVVAGDNGLWIVRNLPLPGAADSATGVRAEKLTSDDSLRGLDIIRPGNRFAVTRSGHCNALVYEFTGPASAKGPVRGFVDPTAGLECGAINNRLDCGPMYRPSHLPGPKAPKDDPVRCIGSLRLCQQVKLGFGAAALDRGSLFAFCNNSYNTVTVTRTDCVWYGETAWRFQPYTPEELAAVPIKLASNSSHVSVL
jgi:hypothetical protein